MPGEPRPNPIRREERVTANPQWFLRRRQPEHLPASLGGLDPIVARVLYARKLEDAQALSAFLDPSRESAGDPFDLQDMAPAVERLWRAIADDEPIAVYGDFDADGVSATALLTLALTRLGARVTPYIPDRFSESYGLNCPALEHLHGEGVRLVVTVDCGIRSPIEVAFGRELGLDLIVTDHHTVPAGKLPPALAVINPKREDSAYPFRDLAGVGVAYRLAQALAQARTAPRAADWDPREYLDLVALGTVADIVPLLGENRALVAEGLHRLRHAPRVGLRALMAAAGVAPERLDATGIAFRLAPRMNAAGRLEHATLAYELVTSDIPDRAEALAAELGRVNERRQQLLEQQFAQAQAQVAENEGLLFVDGPDYHEGIVGLVASRLVESYARPALVMRRGDEWTRGSARSLEGFHITHALDACADLLARYGGHAQAAGFTLATANLEPLRARLGDYAREHLDPAAMQPRLMVDAIVGLADLSEETPRALAALGPFGEGNPEPLLATRGLRLVALRAVGRDSRHLRLTVSDGSRYIEGIAFRQVEWAGQFRPGDLVDVAYQPSLNEWQSAVALQLVVQAMRPQQGRTL